MLDRRIFLHLASLSPWLSGAPPKTDAAGRRAVVVGAGVAGCSAALALADAGLDVELLEPRGVTPAGFPSGVAGELPSTLGLELALLGADLRLGPWAAATPVGASMPRLTRFRDGCRPSAIDPHRGEIRVRAGFEPEVVACGLGGVQVRDRRGEEVVADVAVVALARDGLRRVRWGGAARDRALGGTFHASMRDALIVTILDRGRRETLAVVGGAACWLESLPGAERALQLRHRFSATRGSPSAALEVVAVESLRRCQWPVDLGWEPRDGQSRTACITVGDAGHGAASAADENATLALTFCGSHRTAVDGLQGLVESGLAAAAQALRNSSRASVRSPVRRKPVGDESER